MTNNRIKVVFVLPSLRAGGAERVMSFIAQNLEKSRFDASLLIVGFEKDKAFLTKDVKIKYLNTPRVSRSFFKITNTIRKDQPDIVISAIGHLNILISLISVFFPKKKFIGRETNVKSVRRESIRKKIRLGLNLHKLSFKLLDVIICQSNDMLEDLKKYDDIDESKFVIINNPITDAFFIQNKKCHDTHIQYITVGALHQRKGHDRILKALSKVDHSFNYKIIGNGDYDLVSDKIEELKLENHITHIKFTNDVAKELTESDVFLNGSYVEGFSNSMIESCAVGTPIVAYNAPGGINEIMINGINGFIANTEEEFINYLNMINKDNPFSIEKVSESVTSRYSKEIIVSKYESLFENLKSGKPIK